MSSCLLISYIKFVKKHSAGVHTGTCRYGIMVMGDLLYTAPIFASLLFELTSLLLLVQFEIFGIHVCFTWCVFYCHISQYAIILGEM